MAKNNKFIFIGLGILVLFIAFLLPTGTKTKDFLEVRFYDANGNLVASSETFATICPPGSITTPPCSASGIVSMGFDMNVQNTGNTPLNFNIQSVTQSVTGSEANNAFVTRSINGVAATTTATFSSNTFTIPSAWIGQSITFTGTVGATVVSTGATLPPKTGQSLTLVFNQDPSGSFTVTSFTYRTGSGTATTTLPGSTGYVRFRTTNLLYDDSISALAYTASCGSTLIAYGSGGGGGYSSGNCPTGVTGCVGATLLLNNLPGSLSGISGHTGTISGLWQCSTDIIVCENDDDGVGFAYRRYSTGDSSASLVSTSPNSITSALEVSC